MAVRFVIGRSGTGKTHHCVSAIAEALLQKENRPLLFLVPEQATHQASEAILKQLRLACGSKDGILPGYNRLHVLSFDRLTFMVLGKNTARPAISRLGRSMVIQRILRDCSNKLKVFGNSAKTAGLGKRIADTISQFHQYANSPDDIKNLVKNLKKDKDDALTAAKFDDLGIIFEQYIKFIKGKFIDPDIQLASACKAAAASDLIKGARLWVDGFAGFTTSELALLTELIRAAQDTEIGLCLDGDAIDLKNPQKDKIEESDLFGYTAQTYSRLFEIIKKCKLKLLPPKILKESVRFSKNPSLSHIEKNLFNQNAEKISSGEKIKIISAANVRAEVRFAARQISNLVKDQGYRYRDIAVIASDLESYESYIKGCFDDYNIPVFIDKRRPLNEHPVIELICSALNILINDFPTGEILAYLKTELACVQRDEIDLLENYCLAFGIGPDDWKDDRKWDYAGQRAEEFSEKEVNEIHKKAIGPLLELKQEIINSSKNPQHKVGGLPDCSLPPEQFTKTIFDFLELIKIREQLSGWVNEAISKEDYAAADEHRQFYDRLIDIFDEMNAAFEGMALSYEDYLSILRNSFSQITLAFIPPNLDCVLAGSIERSRHPDLKAVFLIGATERQFPLPIAFDSILSEEDRLAAQAKGIELSPGARQELTKRPYLTYIAFTRPSEFLYISYPQADQKGNLIVRSSFIDKLIKLFDDLKEQDADFSTEFEDVRTKYELEDILCQTQSGKILEKIIKDEQLSIIATRAANAINYKNQAVLDNNIIGELFGKELAGSVSRLSEFAKCPYGYFMKYILCLKKREEFKLEPPDLGEFYHTILDRFTQKIAGEKIDLQKIADSRVNKILDYLIEEVLCEGSFISKFAAHGPHNAFIITCAREYLHNCVISILQMTRAGDFRPVMSEIIFGKSKSQGESIGELKLKLSDGRLLSLGGRIDRMDVANIDGRKAAVIFDYKKRPESFNWTEFYHGIDIQLAVYMLAIRNAGGKFADEIAGAFYIPIEARPKNLELRKTAENTDKFDHKARGIFNGDYALLLDKEAVKDSRYYNFYIKADGTPYGSYSRLGSLYPGDFESFIDFSSRKIIEIAEQIVSGKITASPYRLGTDTPCGYCDYKAVCRFDWQINRYNLLSSADKEGVLRQIKKDEPKQGK